MKNYIKLIIILLSINIQAQKIKIKKGEIFVDKIKIGNIEKVKIKNDSTKDVYQLISNNKGEKVLKYRTDHVKSLLYIGDKFFGYFSIEDISTNKRVAIEDKGYYGTKKHIVKHLLQYDILNENGTNTKYLAEYLADSKPLPSDIVNEINKEKEKLKFVDHKIERNLSGAISISFSKTTIGQVSDLKYQGITNKSRYTIYQGIDVSKKMIGYATVEWKSETKANSYSQPNPEKKYQVVVHNTKNVPLASYLFITYKTYHPYEELGPTKNKLGRLKKVKDRINYIVRDLVNKNII